ncbi:MAG: hypothetical protein ACYSU7_06220 [Planctomycetota bacterium]
MTIDEAIQSAERLLPGTPAPDDAMDPRWQAIIEVGEYIESEPEKVLQFVLRWGGHAQDDLRMAIATCLLEHLLGCHFDLVFPRVEAAAKKDPLFGDMFCSCGKFDQTELPDNSHRFDKLLESLGRKGLAT